jgi:hypothetical protein
MTRETAAARSAALLRKLDAGLNRDDLMRHAPNCLHPGVAHERGHSITVTRCLGCGAITTTRNGTQ